ncbi:hypothetical protein [Paenibacillus pectinilyticus]|nr:hypothetical protein [Paenibacillus pectinilyticus]
MDRIESFKRFSICQQNNPNWSVDTLDWDGKSVLQILSSVR